VKKWEVGIQGPAKEKDVSIAGWSWDRVYSLTQDFHLTGGLGGNLSRIGEIAIVRHE